MRERIAARSSTADSRSARARYQTLDILSSCDRTRTHMYSLRKVENERAREKGGGRNRRKDREATSVKTISFWNVISGSDSARLIIFSSSLSPLLLYPSSFSSSLSLSSSRRFSHNSSYILPWNPRRAVITIRELNREGGKKKQRDIRLPRINYVRNAAAL